MNVTTIRVEKVTKERLDRLRTKESYGDLLERMVAYFERTGINPNSSYIPPDEVVKKQISRVIEVIRGVEKSQLVHFKNLTDLLVNIETTKGRDLVIQEKDPDSLSLEELQEFMKKYEELDRINRELRAENSRLKITSDGKAREAPEKSFDIEKLESIKSVVSAIENMANPFVNEQLLIRDAAAFKSALSRIKEELMGL